VTLGTPLFEKVLRSRAISIAGPLRTDTQTAYTSNENIISTIHSFHLAEMIIKYLGIMFIWRRVKLIQRDTRPLCRSTRCFFP